MFACWQPAFASVPSTASCMPRNSSIVLQDCGARWMFVDARMACGVVVTRGRAPRAATRGRTGQRGLRRLVRCRGGCAIAAVDRERSGMAVLHQRYDRATQGSGLSHGNLLAMSLCFLADVEAHPSRRRDTPSGPALARIRAVRIAACPGGRRECRPAVRRIRSRRDLVVARTLGSLVLVRRADDGQASCRASLTPKCATGPAQEHRLRWRADVRRGLQGRVGGAGTETRADLRSGRIADDDHRDVACRCCRRRRARRRRASWLGRRRADRHRGSHRGRRRCRVAGRRRWARCWCAVRR